MEVLFVSAFVFMCTSNLYSQRFFSTTRMVRKIKSAVRLIKYTRWLSEKIPWDICVYFWLKDSQYRILVISVLGMNWMKLSAR